MICMGERRDERISGPSSATGKIGWCRISYSDVRDNYGLRYDNIIITSSKETRDNRRDFA